MTTNAAVLEARDLSRTLDQPGGPKSLLRNVSFRLDQGQVLAVLGPSGYLALRHKHQQVQQAVDRVQALEARNRELNQSIHALSSDPTAIEGIAREQLHLTRPGEIVYTYPVAPTANGTAAAELH